MIDSLKQRCDLFVKNRDIMKSNFKCDNSMLFPLCASLYAEKGLEIDPNKIKASKEIIKNNTGIFSNFKSTQLLALATMLSFVVVCANLIIGQLAHRKVGQYQYN